MRTTSTSPVNASGPHLPTPPRAPASLDALLSWDADHLSALYAAARTPRLPDLTGDLRGRLLAWTAVGGPVATALRALARSDRFPWRGKTFRHDGETRGDGDNRVFADRLHRYRFITSVGPSRAGAFDAVHLDYDHAENPFFVRPIHDEIRELGPGLYLGQAWLIRPGTARLVLYFGLER